MKAPTDKQLLGLLDAHTDRAALAEQGVSPRRLAKFFEGLRKSIGGRAAAGAGAEPPPCPQTASPGKGSDLIIHTDGASRNNPGPAGFGYVITDKHGHHIESRGEFIGKATNNIAEYKAMIAAVTRAGEIGARAVEIRADSELVQRQVTGRYQVRAPHLKPLLAELMAALGRIPRWSIRHVPRQQNAPADRLAKRAIEARGVVR